MTNKSFTMVAGTVLAALLTVPALAADRRLLSTCLSEAATHLPMLERLPATNRLRLAIALPLRDRDKLATLLQELYDPGNPNFRRYLTPEEFAARFGPREEDYQRVISYAQSNGLKVGNTFSNRALVDVTGTVDNVQKMFQVHINLYQHPKEDRRFYSPDVEPSVEAGLPILHVSGMDNYFTPRHCDHAVRPDKSPTLSPKGGSNPGGYVGYGGRDFRNAYVPGSKLTGAGQVVGLLSLAGYFPSDIYAYETNTGLPTTAKLVNVLQTLPGGDAEITSDIECVIAMAPGVSQINIYESDAANWWDIILNEMANPSHGETLPKQISNSFGLNGDPSVEQSVMEMAAQGQSFIAASGDGGAYFGPYVETNQYFADWITYVGGTQLFMNGSGASWANEVVWHDQTNICCSTDYPNHFPTFSSCGGCITNTPIPFFQQSVSMALNGGSTVYRDFPDVAMVARDILIYMTNNGQPSSPWMGWLGTSASSPLFAGFIALVNEQASNAGLPSVGFLNPALYGIGQSPLYTDCFHDITNGGNFWYLTDTGINSGGLYLATEGYDLCTGWGTPNGTNLINALALYGGYGSTNTVWVDYNYTGSTQNGTYYAPYKTFAQAVAAVPSGGQVWFRTSGSKDETLTVTNAMSVHALFGPVTIGQ